MTKIVSSAVLACAVLACGGTLPAEEITAAQVKADPSEKNLNQYFGQEFRKLFNSMSTDVKAAEKQLSEMKEFVAGLDVKDDKAKALLGRAKAAFDFYDTQLAIAKVSLAEVKAKLAENANDLKNLSVYFQKAAREIMSDARSNPDKAEASLQAEQKFLAELKEKANDEAKEFIDGNQRQFARIEAEIETGKKHAKIVGSPAIPLEVERWANGDPVTDEDLKGKVVVLDFWAVWCGPCIATFPHLIEWHEEYADKGLVIIGLTNKYNYKWDDESGRAARSTEEVSTDDEVAMLNKFAQHHKLLHRIGLQADNSGMADHYGVSGIPHIVVIGRDGKVKLMRVGSGPQTAKDVGAAIAEEIAKSN